MAEFSNSGFASSGTAEIYFETGGNGADMIMIHAGVADHRQWNEAFDHFSTTHRVLRYDMRGYGRSEPVDETYRPIDDLKAVMNASNTQGAKIMMGCSMGGTLAMDYTLTHPEEVSALIMVCSGPSGLRLDIEAPTKFEEVEKAARDNDWDRVCELETQIWFDGNGRQATDVDPVQRALLYEMNRLAIEKEMLELGTREHDTSPAACKRMGEITCPVLIITGELDIPFMAAAADLMQDAIPHAQREDFADAAHLPNMEHPDQFNHLVEKFLATV